MQAALAMYFPPRQAVQAFWSQFAELLRTDSACAGLDIPEELSWPANIHTQWQQPDLLVGQACGYPLATSLKGRVQLVGTFAYDAPGVQGINCRSQLICHAHSKRHKLEDFAGSTLAFNDVISQSGYNALRALLANSRTMHPFFSKAIETGAHYRSIDAVRTGAADMAAVDPVSWAHWQRSNPQQRDELKVFGESESYPGLPLITSLQTTPAVTQTLRRALQRLAHEDSYAALRAPLLIKGFVETRPADYAVCVAMQERAMAAGMHSLME